MDQHALEAEARPVQARQPLRRVAGRQASALRSGGPGQYERVSHELLYSVPVALCAATAELAERLSIPD